MDSGRHRSPSHCSATRPRSLCDAPAHETATPIRLTALRRLWAGSSADYINRPHRLARLQGVLSTRHTPLRNDQCALHVLLGSGTGDRSYLLVGTGASHVNYRHGADRCSVAGSGGGSGSLKILAGVLVHPAGRRDRSGASLCFVWVVAGRYLGTLCVDSTDPFANLSAITASPCASVRAPHIHIDMQH